MARRPKFITDPQTRQSVARYLRRTRDSRPLYMVVLADMEQGGPAGPDRKVWGPGTFSQCALYVESARDGCELAITLV